jgi:hypothetical protein
MTMNARTPRMSGHQVRYLAYIEQHPGCSIADVDRACRQNPTAGHKWVYDGVGRLVTRGIVRREPGGNRWALYPVAHGAGS